MKTKLSLLMIMFLMIQSVVAQNYTKEKSVTESFLAEKYTELNINNKYGDVFLFPSDNDSIHFKVKLSASDKKEYEAEEQLAEMNVHISKSAYVIQASTIFNGNENNFKTDFKMFTGNIFNSSKSIRVDYEVYVPNGLTVNITNAYGNVVVDEYKGDFTVNINAGDFTVGILQGKSKIEMRGGVLRAHYISDAVIIADMTEINIDSISKAYFESRGAQVNIHYADKLTVDSKRDKWIINEVNTIGGSGNFSTFNVSVLTNEAVLKTFYGDVSFHKLGPDFSKVSLITSSGDVIIGLPTGVEPSFQCEMKKTRSVFPASLNLQTDTLDAKNQMFRVYNKPDSATQYINLNTTGGSLSVF